MQEETNQTPANDGVIINEKAVQDVAIDGPTAGGTIPSSQVGNDLEMQMNDSKEQSVDHAAANDGELLVNFEGLDDPDDPHNWSPPKKWIIMLLVSLSGLVTLMSGSMIAPALSNIGQDLSLDDATAQLSLSIFVLSYAVGPMLLAPVTELYGRRPIWLFCGCLYVLWNTVCGLARNNATMIASRLLAGVGASAEFAVTVPILADTWRPEERGKGYALSSAIPLLGTAVGPIIGGVITQALGWRWLFWIVSIFACCITVAGFFFLPETYGPILLTRKAKILRKATGREYCTEFERSTKSLQAKLQLLKGGPRVLDRSYAYLKKKNRDVAAPEYRVPLMVPSWILLSVGLFWYGWAGETRAYWLVADVGVGIFSCGVILGVQSASAYVVDSYLQYTASAYAASQLLRSITAFAFPIFAPTMYQSLGYGWGNSLLAFLALAIGIPASLLL